MSYPIETIQQPIYPSHLPPKRLKISPEVLSNFNQLESGLNPAYTHPDLDGIVFMQFDEVRGEERKSYFTILDAEVYEKIKRYKWYGYKGYVWRNAGVVNGKNKLQYLHQVACVGLKDGLQVHHKNGRFDNRASSLVPVTVQDHDHHRSCRGTLKIK